MALLDFDGDYGRTHNARIRRQIPAYNTIFELAAATAAALQPQAQQVLASAPPHEWRGAQTMSMTPPIASSRW